MNPSTPPKVPLADASAPLSLTPLGAQRSLTPPIWNEACVERAFFEHCRVLITGGTGSLGKALTRLFIDHLNVATVVVYSRDEFKQSCMVQTFDAEQRQRIQFVIGDVRDVKRLKRALRNVDYVVHAAALKHVDLCEVNPEEAVKTNVFGALHVIEACEHAGVKRVVALSTDKACSPINLYGATKLCSDKLFVAANYMSTHTSFAVVRYGNVFTSRGSVVPFFNAQEGDTLPVTHADMTRFTISIKDACNILLKSMVWMFGGELFVPRIPSYRIMDVVQAFGKQARIVGIRPGEKLHEVMIPKAESQHTLRFDDHFIVCPRYPWYAQHRDALLQLGATAVGDRYEYSSANNDFLDVSQLQALIEAYKRNAHE